MCIGLDVADFDGDGKLDVVTASFYSNSMSVFYGLGNGSLKPGVEYQIGKTTRAATAGDFNRDGRPDFVASTAFMGVNGSAGTNLVVVLGQRHPGLVPHPPHSIPHHPHSHRSP